MPTGAGIACARCRAASSTSAGARRSPGTARRSTSSGAELEVGRTLVVDLPRPRRRSSADRPAEPLEERLAAAEAEAEAAREELARLREDLSTAAEETEGALTVARETEASLREEATGLKAELERAQGLLEQRESQLGATRAGLERERTELRELRDRLDEAEAELVGERERLANATEDLEREREETQRLRERAAEPATEAHVVEEASGEEWPLEPAPLPPATAAAAERPAPDPAPADTAPPDGDDDAPEEAPAVPLGPRAEEPRDERSHPVTNGDAPSIEVWAARVSSAKEQEGGSESPRTLELPGLEAVKEKGAKALSSLLGHDEPDPEPVLARPRATAASRAGTRVRAPQGARSRTVRQHSATAIWVMRIAAVTVLLFLVVVLAVVLNVIF